MSAEPRPIPWDIVARLMGAALPPLLAVAFLAHELLPALAAGLVAGGAAFAGDFRRAAAGTTLAVGAAGAVAALPWLGPWGAALLLALPAGWEAARPGGRALTLSLFAFVLFSVGLHEGATLGSSLPIFVAGAIGAMGVVHWLRLAGLSAPPPEGPAGGAFQAVFLILALLLSRWLIGDAPEPEALWILYIFLFRAVSAGEHMVERTLVYAVGAVAGGLAVIALSLLGPLALWLRLALAAPAAAVGARYAPTLSPVSGATLTFAVLLTLAPEPQAALFRIEVAVGVALIVLLVAEGLRAMLRRAIEGRAPTAH
jgi:hypothetical protein